MQQDDTISAIATAIGEGGIGIVRMSGARSIEIAEGCFRPSGGRRLTEYAPRMAIFGRIYDERGRFLDEALCIVMKGPHSYTCEDVVELQCHGGGMLLRHVLGLTYRLGARPAEPGEFTRRAFMNGRLDLSQAQSVMDMIQARTRASLAMASGNLQGRLSEAVGSIRQEILEIIAHLEASIDFPEDDIEEVALSEAEMRVEHIQGEVQDLFNSADVGRVLKDGLRTAIIGRPNAGKSSLMNLMLGQERAIVTDIPGTTRDSIEEYINMGGIPLRLADTAGIRSAESIVEKIGVERAYSHAREAELVLAVFDGFAGIQEDDEAVWQLLGECRGRIIVILNKSDLGARLSEKEAEALAREKGVKNICGVISMSAKSGSGMKELEEKIQSLVFADRTGWQESVLVSDARQQDILRQALLLLEQTRMTLMNGMSEDFVVIDLRSAWEKLGEITGDTLGEDIIDEIFSRFCIGK